MNILNVLPGQDFFDTEKTALVAVELYGSTLFPGFLRVTYKCNSFAVRRPGRDIDRALSSI